jgi:oxalate decarboxylase/phosphoglucose isomerase-like protein (cupin superfamily)
MNQLLKKAISGLVLTIIASVSSAEEFSLAHIASPEHYNLVMENEHVLVLKMVLKPGEADRAHRHHNETVYFQKGGQLTITEKNGKSLVADIPDGHVMWHEAWAHQVSNTGETEVIAIIIEQK